MLAERVFEGFRSRGHPHLPPGARARAPDWGRAPHVLGPGALCSLGGSMRLPACARRGECIRPAIVDPGSQRQVAVDWPDGPAGLAPADGDALCVWVLADALRRPYRSFVGRHHYDHLNSTCGIGDRWVAACLCGQSGSLHHAGGPASSGDRHRTLGLTPFRGHQVKRLPGPLCGTAAQRLPVRSVRGRSGGGAGCRCSLSSR